MILIVCPASGYVHGECEAEGGLQRAPGECSASRRPLTHNYKSLKPFHGTTQYDCPTQRRHDEGKGFICLFSNVAICLMNETDFMKCQGYLLVSNLEYKHATDPSARSWNGFTGRHVECHASVPTESGRSQQKRWSAHRFYSQRRGENLKS